MGILGKGERKATFACHQTAQADEGIDLVQGSPPGPRRSHQLCAVPTTFTSPVLPRRSDAVSLHLYGRMMNSFNHLRPLVRHAPAHNLGTQRKLKTCSQRSGCDGRPRICEHRIEWMSIASAVLLTGYFCLQSVVAFPSDDPQQGMARGFIILVGLVLLSFAAALDESRETSIPGGRTVLAVSIFPALSQTAQEIFLFVHRGH